MHLVVCLGLREREKVEVEHLGEVQFWMDKMLLKEFNKIREATQILQRLHIVQC